MSLDGTTRSLRAHRSHTEPAEPAPPAFSWTAAIRRIRADREPRNHPSGKLSPIPPRDLPGSQARPAAGHPSRRAVIRHPRGHGWSKG